MSAPRVSAAAARALHEPFAHVFAGFADAVERPPIAKSNCKPAYRWRHELIACKRCGIGFLRKYAHYRSLHCSACWGRRPRPASPPPARPTHCHTCGTPLAPSKRNGRPRLYCSATCRYARTRYQPRPIISVDCAFCGRSFSPRRTHMHYCSPACRNAHRYAAWRADLIASRPIIKRQCPNCSVLFTVRWPARPERLFCSRRCCHSYRARHQYATRKVAVETLRALGIHVSGRDWYVSIKALRELLGDSAAQLLSESHLAKETTDV